MAVMTGTSIEPSSATPTAWTVGAKPSNEPTRGRAERTDVDAEWAIDADGSREPGSNNASSSSSVTGAWRPGDLPGNRQFAQLGALHLESGAVLPQVHLAYETWGQLNADRSNAVLVLHALTGDSHVCGPAGPGHPSEGWWPSVVGPGRPIDTEHWFVIAANVLGGCQGSTGPSSPGLDGRPWGSRFPSLTIRDQVAAEIALADHLGIDSFALVIGGSMGGMRAVEWAVTVPHRVQRLVLTATGARASADQIAWNSAQVAAIHADPGFAGGDYYDHALGGGPHTGLGIARRIAHTTYRAADQLEERFGNQAQHGEDPLHGTGRHQVTSYLDHHADKLIRRFDANSYLVLVRAMNTHDVGRDRGGLEEALGRIRARTLAISFDSDRLFPPAMATRMAQAIPGAHEHLASSPVGHDAFLLPHPDVEQWVRDFLGS